MKPVKMNLAKEPDVLVYLFSVYEKSGLRRPDSTFLPKVLKNSNFWPKNV